MDISGIKFTRFDKAFSILRDLYVEKCMLEDGEGAIYVNNLLKDLFEALGPIFEDAIDYDAGAYLVDSEMLEHLFSVCEGEG